MFPGLSGLRVTCDHVATETQIFRIQCPHLLHRTYVPFLRNLWPDYPWVFRDTSAVFVAESFLLALLCPLSAAGHGSLHRLMNSVPWANPPRRGSKPRFPASNPAAFLSVFLALQLYAVVLRGQGQRPSLFWAYDLLAESRQPESKAQQRAWQSPWLHLDPYRCVVMGRNVKCYKSWWCWCDRKSVT